MVCSIYFSSYGSVHFLSHDIWCVLYILVLMAVFISCMVCSIYFSSYGSVHFLSHDIWCVLYILVLMAVFISCHMTYGVFYIF